MHKFVVILPNAEAANYFSTGLAELFTRWLPSQTQVKRRGDRVLVAIENETILLPTQPPPKKIEATYCPKCNNRMEEKESTIPVADSDTCDCEDFYFEPDIHHASCSKSSNFQGAQTITSVNWNCPECNYSIPKG